MISWFSFLDFTKTVKIGNNYRSLFRKEQRSIPKRERLLPVFHSQNTLASSVACALGVAATFIHLMMTSKACDCDTPAYARRVWFAFGECVKQAKNEILGECLYYVRLQRDFYDETWRGDW